jgi:hypothetical protein
VNTTAWEIFQDGDFQKYRGVTLLARVIPLKWARSGDVFIFPLVSFSASCGSVG